MAIFSRRTIQRLLNENALFITREQSANHVRRLNEGDLSFEWEVVLLNVFSKIGKVVHEPNFENSKRKIDILFSSENEGKIEFLSDVATVSDYFAEWENPLEYLNDKLLQIKWKNKLPGGFGCVTQGNTPQTILEQKKQELFIPTKTDFDRKIFNKDFKAFVNEIIKFPRKENEFLINRNGIKLKITYSLSRFSFSTNPSYKEIITLEDNTIWKALIRKYNQLKEINYQGHLGIIICDGDCQSLKSISSSWYGKTSGAVIRHFLKKKNKVTFVLVFYVEQPLYGERHKIVCRIFRGRNFDNDFENFLLEFNKNINNFFPVPERTPSNALNFMKFAARNKGASFFGGFTMRDDEIKISVRTVLDLLAGKISYDEFPEFYRDFFKRKLSEGKLIEEVNLEREHERDDDWLDFKFGKSDPAVSRYQVP